MGKDLSYLFHYHYPDLQNHSRSLEALAHPSWIEIGYATDYFVEYQWFVDGVFPEMETYQIGNILLTYTDQTEFTLPIIFGELSFWTAGGISGIRMEQVLLVLPWTLIGILIAMYVSKSVTLLSFGEEVAIGLGSNLNRVRVLSGLTVLILSGSAVALAGPIGFVGLVIPHITRKLVGIDYRLVIPFSALFGAVLVMIADVVARIVNPPFETPLGAITALVGVPFFIYLANRKGGK